MLLVDSWNRLLYLWFLRTVWHVTKFSRSIKSSVASLKLYIRWSFFSWNQMKQIWTKTNRTKVGSNLRKIQFGDHCFAARLDIALPSSRKKNQKYKSSVQNKSVQLMLLLSATHKKNTTQHTNWIMHLHYTTASHWGEKRNLNIVSFSKWTSRLFLNEYICISANTEIMKRANEANFYHG